MNPSFKDISAFRATAPTPTDAMRVMLGHPESPSASYILAFLEIIPLVLGAPYAPPPFGYHNIHRAVELPPRAQERLSKLGFKGPSHISAWLASMNGPQQLEISLQRLANDYIEDLLSNHQGPLRFVIEEVNRLRVSAMRSPPAQYSYTSESRRLAWLLLHIDERDLQGALDAVCVVYDVLMWVKVQYPRVVAGTGISAEEWEGEVMGEREGRIQEAVCQIAEFADGRCAHRLLRRMIGDLL